MLRRCVGGRARRVEGRFDVHLPAGRHRPPRRDLLFDAMALIAALDAELKSLYPEEGATHFRLDPAEVAEGAAAFMVAYRDGVPVGCGAVRLIDANTAEVKRM